MSLHYHPCKANMVANSLSKLSMGSLSHMDKEKRDFVRDINRLDNLGVRLLDSKDSGVIVAGCGKVNFCCSGIGETRVGPYLNINHGGYR